jgi:hypothetical protein
MARSPILKVYRDGEYVASCKYYEDAAAICGMGGNAKVKLDHGRTIWTEGSEVISAGDSWDEAGTIMRDRVENRA